VGQREPTAAQALYGHLPSGVLEPVKQSQPNLADAMYPRPQLTRREIDDLWRDHLWALAGLRRKR